MKSYLQRSPNITQMREYASHFNRTFKEFSPDATMSNCQTRSNRLEEEDARLPKSEDLKEPERKSSTETVD